jgi:F-type H+-transporting ATPase subunit a
VDQVILAIDVESCQENDVICTPDSINELFETPTLFTIGDFDFTRMMFLTLLAAFIVVALLWFGFRKRRMVPTKFGAAMEALVGFVRDEIAIGIIGPKYGRRYVPYLLSLFMFILVGNLFEVTPLINFPITSRMAIPLFLALLTWVIFVVAGFRHQGLAYVGHIVWPPGVPVALKPLVGLIELVSIFLVRPFSLAVRLFANMVAGHTMLTLLFVSAFAFLQLASAKLLVGVAWGGLALAIYLFEIVVAILQAYIFTLLSAVYIQTSVNPEH